METQAIKELAQVCDNCVISVGGGLPVREVNRSLLKELGIEGDYEGIGHCALGYAAEPAKAPAPRKENYVYYIK